MASPLDHWAKSEWDMDASMAFFMHQKELIDHIIEMADEDKEYWQPSKDEMLDDQRFWEVGSRRGESHWRTQEGAETEDIQVSEVVELNDGFLAVDKLSSMMSAEDLWGLDVLPKAKGDMPGVGVPAPDGINQMPISYEDAAQAIENMLRWADDELNDKHVLQLNSPMAYTEAYYALLRGWLCGMIIPNPQDAEVPWSYVIEDPLFVYPRYSRSGLIRVFHRYEITVLEARDEFPESIDFFVDREDEEEVEVITYYDDRYRTTLVTDMVKTNISGSLIHDGRVVYPLVEHGYVDIKGRPINPWIIVTPKGTPTRRRAPNKLSPNTKDVVKYIGIGILRPIKDMITKLEKLASQIHTEVAKDANPASVDYYRDGSSPPEPADLGVGGHNFRIMDEQKLEIIESTAMSPDTQALLTMYSDRIQRGTVPPVLYGSGMNAQSGYMVNLLSQAAKDVLRPYLEAIRAFRRMKYRRMLEMYASIGSQFAGPLNVRSTDPQSGQTYSAGAIVTPEMIIANGVHVEVTYEEITPRDTFNIMTSVIGGLNAGLVPLFDAMKMIGIKDPNQGLVRLGKGIAYKDPMFQRALAEVSIQESGTSLEKKAWMLMMMQIQQQQQMEAEMAAAKGKGGTNDKGSPKSPVDNYSSANVPSNIAPGAPSTPSNIDPITAIMNQLRSVGAAENVSNGGTPPNQPYPGR